MKFNKKERELYFGIQKASGLFISLIGVILSLLILDPCALITVVIGVWMYRTDEMVFLDYYDAYHEELEIRERKERMRRKRKMRRRRSS